MKLITPYMEWMRLTYYFGVDCKVREYWVQHFGVLCLWKVLFDWLSVLKLFSLFFSHHNLASTFLLVSVSKLILQGDWSKPCKTNQVHLPPSIACIIQSLIRLPYIRHFLSPEKKKKPFHREVCNCGCLLYSSKKGCPITGRVRLTCHPTPHPAVCFSVPNVERNHDANIYCVCV